MQLNMQLLTLVLMILPQFLVALQDIEPPMETVASSVYQNHTGCDVSDTRTGTTSLPFVLVTGANGLIGSSLVQELLKRGFRVRGSVRDASNPVKTAELQSLTNADSNLEIVSFDLKETDPDNYRKLLDGGIEWVFHAAAVVNLKAASYSDEAKLIEEASQAVVFLLTAAKETPSVTQFVYTGSSSAIGQGHDNDPVRSKDDYVLNEDDWTNVHGPNIISYAKIKTLTERTAWDFVENNNVGFRFTSLLPTVVLGPMTSSKHNLSSMRLIQRILGGNDPGQINMFVAICDIRDVVHAHIQAATLPDISTMTYRRRFLLTQTDGGNLFVPEISNILRQHFGPMGYSIPSILIPKWICWILSWFDGELASIYSRINKCLQYNNDRSIQALELTYRNVPDTIIDATHSLIQLGLLPKAKDYQAPTCQEL